MWHMFSHKFNLYEYIYCDVVNVLPWINFFEYIYCDEAHV